jgi:hypothetical protein
MRRISVCSSVVALAGFLIGASAYAQAPAAEGGGASGSTASASFTSANASRGRGLGVGAATMLNGTSGLAATWGTGGFHVDGLVGLHRYTDGNTHGTTSFTLGGRGWYHLHAASFADFSLGGGLGLTRWVSNPGTNASNSHLDVSLEVGSQIRAFIVPNVALTADAGLGFLFADNDDILLGAQSIGGGSFVAGSLGILYFFE